jgi:hypothetical protein
MACLVCIEERDTDKTVAQRIMAILIMYKRDQLDIIYNGLCTTHRELINTALSRIDLGGL